ncbi:hypothetical protein HB364_31880 [Pseudoflavitalea sp. X16]|nr:hypothetical protein [Paraflavitalea devenefica]NII29721.1 hypothetical protein [Paraflavitalea devenefica]
METCKYGSGASTGKPVIEIWKGDRCLAYGTVAGAVSQAVTDGKQEK